MAAPTQPFAMADLVSAAHLLSTGQMGLATFEVSVRTLPPNRSYLVVAGLEAALTLLEEQRVHDRLPPLLQVDQPLAVDLLLEIHGLPRASEALPRDDGLALRDVR